MKTKSFYLLFIFFATSLIYSCRSDRSKEELDHTTSLCEDRLFLEVYKIIGGGGHGGDRVSDYLTDSSNFRMYIGTFNNADRGYSFTCSGDSVSVYFLDRTSTESKILSVKTYSIQNLKNKRIQD